MTTTQNYGNIISSTPILSADPNVKEDVMTDQQKITILYCRLSNEDSQDRESNSIQNQRELLTRYARDHGYTNLKVLIDDGYTGTNFQRPGVQEGFELVKQGLVGCWLVKDLSRFGRDYLTVGQYTDIIFPSYDVRFIAVNAEVEDALDHRCGVLIQNPLVLVIRITAVAIGRLAQMLAAGAALMQADADFLGSISRIPLVK